MLFAQHDGDYSLYEGDYTVHTPFQNSGSKIKKFVNTNKFYS